MYQVDTMHRMKSKAAIRLENALYLQRQSNLIDKEFAELIGVAPTYYGQVKKSGKAGGRNIGDSLKQRIEEAFKKPKNWLDQNRSNEEGITTDVSPFDEEIQAMLLSADVLLPKEEKKHLRDMVAATVRHYLDRSKALQEKL